jgi:hypothetical protein
VTHSGEHSPPTSSVHGVSETERRFPIETPISRAVRAVRQLLLSVDKHMKPIQTFLGSVFVVVVIVSLTGCGSHCLIGTPTPQPTCNVSGGATLSSPPELALEPALDVRGSNCLAETGMCSRQATFSLSNAMGNGMPTFSFYVTMPAVAMGTFALSPTNTCLPTDPSCVDASGSITRVTGTPHLVQLKVVSGTIDLQRSTVSDLDATFAFELQTDTGQPVSVTGGHVSMTGCHLETVCAE